MSRIDVGSIMSVSNSQSQHPEGDSNNIPISSVVPSFICPICGDLFVDAHTIKDCVHTCLLPPNSLGLSLDRFTISHIVCGVCIASHLKDANDCPICHSDLGPNPMLSLQFVLLIWSELK